MNNELIGDTLSVRAKENDQVIDIENAERERQLIIASRRSAERNGPCNSSEWIQFVPRSKKGRKQSIRRRKWEPRRLSKSVRMLGFLGQKVDFCEVKKKSKFSVLR